MKKRVQVTFIIFVVLFGLVIAKASYVQIVQKDRLLAYARNQFIRETKEFSNRGNILDRHGNPLAINIQTWNIHTFPRNKGFEYKSDLKKLSEILKNQSFDQLWDKVKDRKKYTWLARQLRLTSEQVAKIKQLKSIHLESMSTRVYPNKELSSQIIGFTGIDNNGMAGIERSMNETLKGEAQLVRFYRDAKGRPVKYERIKDTARPAKDIILSIDKDLQAVTEKHLKEAVIKHSANRGGAAVMDAQTGEILAIANYPTFDPNNVKSATQESRRLSFVTDPFEPGSIFKTITIASALENKVATANKKYFCEYGKLKVQNHTIHEAESSKKFEWLTVDEILKYSSNVGTTKIAFDLEYEKLRKTILDLGFGQKTGIELGGESKGIMNKSSKISPLTLSNISFGHGIATTGIQMLKAYSAIANGGYLVNPTLIKKEKHSHLKRVLSDNTTFEVTKMLVNAVEDGTGSNGKIPHYQIAGKTGTAQRVSEKGGYDGYVSSFAGFPVNVNKPFVVVVYIDNPKENGYYGNVAAAPVFRKITQYILYKKKDFSKFAHYNSASNAKNLDMINLSQSSSRKVSPGRIPNFIGMDKSSALKLAKNLKVQLNLTGFGVVSKQTPLPDEAIAENGILNLHFSVPKYEE